MKSRRYHACSTATSLISGLAQTSSQGRLRLFLRNRGWQDEDAEDAIDEDDAGAAEPRSVRGVMGEAWAGRLHGVSHALLLLGLQVQPLCASCNFLHSTCISPPWRLPSRSNALLMSTCCGEACVSMRIRFPRPETGAQALRAAVCRMHAG